MTDANRIDGIAHNHGNTAAPSARLATVINLIDEARRLARESRLYPPLSTLADMVACTPEGTPTRAILDVWLHARRQGDERPTIYVGANVLGGMDPTARQALAGLVDLRQSAAIEPDTVVWAALVVPVPRFPSSVQYVIERTEIT